MDVLVVAIAILVLGLYLVSVDTHMIVQMGRGRPMLRLIGQLLAIFGGLCVLGVIFGR